MGEIEVGEYIVEWDDAKNKKISRNTGFILKIRLESFLMITELMILMILTVIYTERGEKLRLISARQADKDDEDEYYGQYQDL